MEEFEWKGEWWLPSDEGTTVAGILKFSKTDGVTLELIGALGSSVRSQSQRVNHSVIHGYNGSGKPITLADSYLIHSRESLPSGMMMQVYRVPVAYIGAHFADPNLEKFNRVDLNLTYLGDWSGISGFKTEQLNADGETKASYSVRYTMPDKISARVDDADIAISFEMESEHERHEKVSLSQATIFSCSLGDGLQFSDLLEKYIVPLQNLVTLAVDKPSSIERIRCFSPSTSVHVFGRVIPDSVDVVFAQRHYHEVGNRKNLVYLEDLIFGAGEIKSDFHSVLAGWLALSNGFKRICDQLFECSYNKDLTIDHIFFSLAVSMESFHRDCYSGGGTSNFGDRIRDLYDNSCDAVRSLIGDKEAFVKAVLDTRNFQAHGDPSRKTSIAAGKYLFFLNYKINMLLRCHFLKLANIGESEVSRMLFRNRNFEFMANQFSTINAL